MNDKNKKTGSVVVVGGGIAGMQASLDLAGSGFKVHLIENSPAIGGNMVRLDKTFPTGDCAMCTIAPRLVECGRHPNIEIITSAEIEKIEGEAGDFTVTVKRAPRFVDLKKCNACGDCEKVCPVSVDNKFDSALSKRKAIYKMYPQAVPNTYSIDKDGISPCRIACPAGVNPQGYVALIRAGKYKEALSLIREAMPFASSCGRVCTHPCETQCSRAEIDDAVSIRSLKRFVADMEFDTDVKKPAAIHKKVAVVGSGPAGLTCAYYLARMGYKVTVFEASPVAGGMLRLCIPDFRLPSKVLDREIDIIRKSGVEIKTNTAVGKDIFFNDLRKDNDAVFIAVGSMKSRQLGIEGENLKGVHYGINFLMDAKLGKKPVVGNNVTVIGGGSTSVDVAMTALRLGAKNVTIVYRRTKGEMPASPEEIESALNEGVKIECLTAPISINGRDGKVFSLNCIKMRQGELDKSGRRKPVPIEGSELSFDTDTVIIAAGQYTDAGFLTEDLRDKDGNIKVNPDNLTTSVPGVFGGGDAATGPDVFVNAVAAGRKASVSIDRFLKGETLSAVTVKTEGAAAKKRADKTIKKTERVKADELPAGGRIKGFEEIELTMTEDMAKAEAQRCLDCGICSECGECVKACMPAAINHNRTEDRVQINTGSVIFTPGFETFDAGLKGEYGYGRYSDVITSIEFERILSASGPYGGEIRRPSDGKTPKKIAFIQCVGSRDKSVNRDYCSAVCCMHSAKEAIIAREHLPESEVSVFYIDVRAYGKGFESYWKRARDEYGVKYIKCMVSKVIRDANTGKLILKYVDNGKTLQTEFDLVVLAVGLEPSKRSAALSRNTGIELSQYDFCSTKTFYPLNTSKPGIFAAGAFQGPKDISESIVQASGSSSEAMELLSSARNTLTVKKEYPPEKDVSGIKERIGVFVCHCGRNIASVVDVKNVSETARGLPGVVHSETNLFVCSPDGLESIRKAVKENNLNRVVVASCSPRTHEALFQENLREAGLNPYLFEMANIRDQCSWVHFSEPALATDKAKKLVRMALAKSRQLEPLKIQSIPVVSKGLVIGGGLSGMTSALSLANQGFEVYLIEKEKELGGNLRSIHTTLEGDDVQKYLAEITDKVKTNGLIKVFTGAEIKEVSGFVGNFKSKISVPEKGIVDIEHGVIIIATGGLEYSPKEYLYGQNKNIITQRELEESIAKNKSAFAGHQELNVVMVHCVGSRNDEHPYCSRVCCSEAVKNALLLKEINPNINVYILYRDIRTYGMKELYYQKALSAGVIFIRYDENNKPEIRQIADSGLNVTVTDTGLNMPVSLNADLAVLSTGIVPRDSRLASLLKLPLTEDGFFLEAHIKLRPVEFATEGVFLCGLAHSPKFIEENISQAKAASARAAGILSREFLDIGGVIAVVDESKCAACLTCVRTCPYNVPVINAKGVAEINPAQCHGCGTCAGACPAQAIQVQQFKDKQILEVLKEVI